MSFTTLPDGVTEAEHLINGLDGCFLLGFSRLGPDQTEALAAIARTFTGTPLGDRLREAVEGLARAEFREEHFVALAAARCALQGAQYDALFDAVAGALTLTRAPVKVGDAPETPGPIKTWMESTRQWLMELALAGFMQLDQGTVLPFIATLEQLQQAPEAVRLSMLLTGYVHELFDAMPIGAMERVPGRRWVDLWSRAMISAMGLPGAPARQEVSGSFSILGMDLRHHTNAVSATFYGVFEGGDTPRFARATISAYKVDVVVGKEIWQAFDNGYEPIFSAYTGSKKLEITSAGLLETGDLILDPSLSGLKVGAKFDLLGTAQRYFSEGSDAIIIADMAALDRHPVQLAAPIYIEGYTVTGGDEPTVDISGESLLLDEVRISTHSDLADGQLAGTKRCFGLIRFDDGQWRVQPLVATKGKKLMMTGTGASTAPKSTSSINVLKERAGKLLRRKA